MGASRRRGRPRGLLLHPRGGDLLARAVGSTTERSLRLATLANSARVTDSQFSNLRAILKDCAARLDLSPLPELFVRLDPNPDARTLGVDNPFIVLSSGALELWDEEELACVLAHEIGHVLSGHSVYKTLLEILIKASSLIAGSMPLGGAAIMARDGRSRRMGPQERALGRPRRPPRPSRTPRSSSAP